MTAPNPADTLPPYFLDRLDVDFRAELLAASLAGQAFAPERIIINPTGPYSRPYSKDIEDFGEWLLDGSTLIYNRIDTPRESLFDMLPPYLFFTPNDSIHTSDADQILDDIRRDHETERQARLFFLPFDAELNYLRTLAVHYDNSVDYLNRATAIVDQFAELWPILNDMNSDQAGLFLQVLPYLHRLRNDLPWFGRFLEFFFGVPVQIETGYQRRESTRITGLLGLGECRLGVDAVVSDWFSNDPDGLLIAVGPVPDALIANFLPHTQSITLLHHLVNYFLAVSSEVTIRVWSQPPAPASPPPPVTFLGYNTFL